MNIALSYVGMGKVDEAEFVNKRYNIAVSQSLAAWKGSGGGYQRGCG